MAQTTLIDVTTNKKTEWIDITDRVREEARRSAVKDGIVLVYVPHTTAGITINEHADPAVTDDIDKMLNSLVPQSGDFSHAEGNSPGHIKASLMGSSVTLFIDKGSLSLGTWQGIFFCEFDGPRRRKVYVKVLKS